MRREISPNKEVLTSPGDPLLIWTYAPLPNAPAGQVNCVIGPLNNADEILVPYSGESRRL